MWRILIVNQLPLTKQFVPLIPILMPLKLFQASHMIAFDDKELHTLAFMFLKSRTYSIIIVHNL